MMRRYLDDPDSARYRTAGERAQETEEEDEEEPEEDADAKRDAESPMTQQFLKTRTVLLTGEVNKSLAERVVRQVLLLAQESEDPIKVFIDSPGGDADAGFAILDMMRFVKPRVKMIGMGLVASAGAIILLASPKEDRFALPNSRYLIHQPAAGFRGVATEIEIHAHEMDIMRQKANELIATESGRSLADVEKDTDRDYWMSAEEATVYGLVGKVVRSQEEV
jgi:ATP-dependent Clp protease protease subunit